MTLLDTPPAANAFEEVVRVRARPTFTIEPASIAWDAVAFTVRGDRDAVMCVPRDALESFFDDLDAGRLDASIEAFLSSPPAGRILRAAAQASKPGLFDAIGSHDSIVPSERVPTRGVLGGIGGGTPADARRNKNRRGRPRRVPARVIVISAVTAAVVIGGVAVLATRKDDEQKVASGTGAPLTTPAAALPPLTKATFTVTFTVTSVEAGSHVEEKPNVGDTTTGTVVVECDAVTCTFTPQSDRFDQGFFGVTSFARTGDHFEGKRFDPGDPAEGCTVVDAADLTSTIDLQRDASGKVVGFTGTNVVHHPNGVETPDHTCGSINATVVFTAVLA